MPGCAVFLEAVHVAVGNHPLQRSFRAATAELLGKYGVPVSKQTQAELEAASDGSVEDSGSGQPDQFCGRPPSFQQTGPLCLLQHTFTSVMKDNISRLLPCPAAGEDSADGSNAGDSQDASAEADGPAAEALLEADHAGSSSDEDDSAEQSTSESDQDAVEAPGCLTRGRLGATAAIEGADRDTEGTALKSEGTAPREEQDAGTPSARPAGAATDVAPAAGGLSEQAAAVERQALPAQAVASGRTATPAAAVEADGSDVPFTLPAPETYEVFRLLVEGRSPQHLALVVQRICAFNATALAAENRRKMQVRQAYFRPVAQSKQAGPQPRSEPQGKLCWCQAVPGSHDDRC